MEQKYIEQVMTHKSQWPFVRLVSNSLTSKDIFSYIPIAKKGGSYQQYCITTD